MILIHGQIIATLRINSQDKNGLILIGGDRKLHYYRILTFSIITDELKRSRGGLKSYDLSKIMFAKRLECESLLSLCISDDI